MELVDPSARAGCTVEEIDRLEAEVGHAMPLAYCDYLRVMGHAPTELLGPYSLTYDDAIGLSEELCRKIQESTSSGVKYSEPVVACGRELGEYIVFLELNGETDNPRVLMHGPENEILCLEAEFSKFIVNTLRYYANPTKGFEEVLRDTDGEREGEDESPF
jgi:hypothetical protein